MNYYIYYVAILANFHKPSLARGHTDEQMADFSHNVLSMTENYTSTLQGLDLDRYVRKLQCLCGRVGESANLSTPVASETWGGLKYQELR